MYCFNFFRNQLWQHLISCNSFRNVNICLFQVVMCEKCKSSNFQSEGGSKQFEDWRRGIKNFRTGGGLLLLAAVSTPLHTMTHNRFYVILCRAKYFVELKKVPAFVKIFSSSWKILKNRIWLLAFFIRTDNVFCISQELPNIFKITGTFF